MSAPWGGTPRGTGEQRTQYSVVRQAVEGIGIVVLMGLVAAVVGYLLAAVVSLLF